MTKLSFAEKLTRLRSRLRDSEWRRYGMLLLMGKAAGIGLILLGAFFMFRHGNRFIGFNDDGNADEVIEAGSVT